MCHFPSLLLNVSNLKVEFVSNLNMYSTANKMRLSGIVCTIGPVSREPATLLELIENGMNVARMNFSHGYDLQIYLLACHILRPIM